MICRMSRKRSAQTMHKTSLLHAGLAGVVAFFRSCIFRLGFLDGAMGFAIPTKQVQPAFWKVFHFVLYESEK